MKVFKNIPLVWAAFFLSLFTFSACSKFTDIVPKKKLIITATQDYDDIMADPLYSLPLTALDAMGSDNITIPQTYLGYLGSTATGKAYFWREDYYTETEDDVIWSRGYEFIYKYNLVIQNVMQAEGGTEADKKRILQEAKVNRAYTYFILNLLYAPAYNKLTAATDLSVPLMLENNLEAKPARASVAEVVKTIEDDLKDAESYLPEKGKNTYRITKAAALALAARFYLYIGEFEKAQVSAEKALALNNKLLDYNTYSFIDPLNPTRGIVNKPITLNSPEVLMYRSTASALRGFIIGPDLQAAYTPEDLRYKFLFTKIQTNGIEYADKMLRYTISDVDFSISVPEMLLVQAETMARKGDAACLTILNRLREKRFAPANWKPLTGSTPAQLLSIVIDERQRELVMQDMRWYDMKRLAQEGVYTKTLVRVYSGTEYRLVPNSNRYLFPISKKLMQLNSAILPNPR